MKSLSNTRIFLDGIHPSPLLVKKCWILILETLNNSTLTSSSLGPAISELPPMVARLSVAGEDTNLTNRDDSSHPERIPVVVSTRTGVSPSLTPSLLLLKLLLIFKILLQAPPIRSK